MITLYTFGPAFGLPDPSPFVTKAEMLLKLAGLSYRTDTAGYRRAPKGKLPYLEDDGLTVADSTFIRWHLEKKYGVDFDAGLTAAERGIAWAVEKMLEDHLYWAILHARWVDDGNFTRGPAVFFRSAPALLRPLIRTVVRRRVARDLHGQGFSRHAPEEIAALAARDLTAAAAILGDKPYLMGERPCGADATLFAFALGALCPLFDTPIRGAVEAQPNLVAYVDHLRTAYFPGFAAET